MTDTVGLIENRSASLARLPASQPSLDALHVASGYTIPLIKDDYPAKTAALWNATYHALAMPHVNAMVVASPASAASILAVFRTDARYLGGGAGVGFKEVVLPHLDHVDPLAAAMGAVNIIVRSADGRLTGHNTDGAGFTRGLAQALRAQRKSFASTPNIVVLGAGGAGNAVTFALALAGARIRIVNRTVERAERLARAIDAYRDDRCEVPPRARVTAHGERELLELLRTADVVVNTTVKGQGELSAFSALGPAGDHADALRENHEAAARAFNALPQSAIVADIILASVPTPLIAEAARRGHPTQDGVPMVVEQAIDAFLLVHPGVAPRERVAAVMWSAV